MRDDGEHSEIEMQMAQTERDYCIAAIFFVVGVMFSGVLKVFMG